MRLSSIAKSKLLLLLAGVVALPCAAQVEEKSDRDYEREELGVNSYTTPSIARIFQQLDELKPLPFDELKREPAAVTHARREQLGLAFGGLIADGFLIVAAEKNDLVDDLGRSLIKEAKSLGVAERVIRHSKSLTELGRRGDWTAVRQELTATQTDVEEAMIELRDQKMAHLISLGGWLRGLEISAGTVMAEFSSARAKVLSQPDLLNYFSEELKTLPPELSQEPLFTKIRAGVKAIRSRLMTNPSGLTAADVRMVHDEAHALNIAIQQSDDSKPEP
ncbi:MAG TPA: hypothetical protein VIL70_02760 [Chthoniobacterales bacterium]|jgi:hypothetical protein